MDVLREEWETLASVEEAPASYVESSWKKLKATLQLAQAELGRAQEEQQCYDVHMKSWAFMVGQQVL